MLIFPTDDRWINKAIPFMTYLLVIGNFAVFLAVSASVGFQGDVDPLYRKFGLVPKNIHTESLFSHMFLHGGWLHVVGNMLFLWFFGRNVERRIGSLVFTLMYLLSGLAAAALFVLFNRDSPVPMVGASGALSGVMGMYMILFLKREIEIFYFLIFFAGTFHVPAFVFLFVWLGTEVAQAVLLNGVVQVANWAHVGGFVAGSAAVTVLYRLIGFQGRPVTEPTRWPKKTEDRFEELAYIPTSPIRPAQKLVAVPERETRRRARTFALLPKSFVPERPEINHLLKEFFVNAPPSYSPHCIAHGLSLPQADDLRTRLEALAVPCALFPDTNLVTIPPLVPVTRTDLTDAEVRFTDASGAAIAVPYSRLYFICAGQIKRPGGTVFTSFDLYATGPWSDYRMMEDLKTPPHLAALARGLLDRARGVSTAKGVLMLAEGRDKPEFFSSLGEYDAYATWLLQLYVSGTFRKPTDNPESAM